MPLYYKGSSVYAMFPFVHPEKTRKDLEALGKVDEYDFAKPSLKPPPLCVKSYQAVADILKDQRSFRVPCKYHQLHLLIEEPKFTSSSPFLSPHGPA